MKNDITDKYDGLIPAGTRPDTADAELQGTVGRYP